MRPESYYDALVGHKMFPHVCLNYEITCNIAMMWQYCGQFIVEPFEARCRNGGTRFARLVFEPKLPLGQGKNVSQACVNCNKISKLLVPPFLISVCEVVKQTMFAGRDDEIELFSFQ